MTKLHEILAVEKTKSAAANKMLAESAAKFNKMDFFMGHDRTLKMIVDSPQNAAIEESAAETREMPTTVQETLEYALAFWGNAEDVIFQKNKSNMYAVSDLHFRGAVIAKDVPVDELLGLESRLLTMRKVFEAIPTLAASIAWQPDTQSGRKGAWVSTLSEVTTKTEKTTVPVVLYEATDKHPAQVKEVSSDKTVGTFKLIRRCGAATSAQKAKLITTIDELLAEVKQARMRANSVEASKEKIGDALVDIILGAFK